MVPKHCSTRNRRFESSLLNRFSDLQPCPCSGSVPDQSLAGRRQLHEIMLCFASWLIRAQLQKRPHSGQYRCIHAVCFGQLTSAFAKPPGLAWIDPRKGNVVRCETRFEQPMTDAGRLEHD